jgi:hypothetical protein
MRCCIDQLSRHDKIRHWQAQMTIRFKEFLADFTRLPDMWIGPKVHLLYADYTGVRNIIAEALAPVS